MIYLVIILAVVFLILTGLVISKTQSIVKGMDTTTEVVDPSVNSEVDSANTANGVGLLVFWFLSIIGIVWSFQDARQYFLPEASSEHGKVTDYWFWVSMIVIMIAFFIVNTVMFYFSYKYRYQKGRKVAFYTHNNNLEIIWTIIPAIVMAGLVFSGLRVWTKVMADAPADAEVIEIMGKQFAWTVRYPGVTNNKLGDYNYKLMDDAGGNTLGVDFSDENSFDDFANTSEMHIPKGKPVLLKIRARDVLHSVFIPHMRVKMDAVPGMPTKFWFTPEKTTEEMRAITGNPDFNYEIACTEVCGKSHFGMKLLLVVEEQVVYNKWKQEQKPMLTENADLIKKVPDNLKAKAMRFLPQEPVVASAVVDETEGSSLGNTSTILK